MLLYLVIPMLPALLLFNSCNTNYGSEKQNYQFNTRENHKADNIRSIPLPEGFKHIRGTDSLFSDWLLSQPLRKDKAVYLYNGNRKQNQDAQLAVLDIDIGKK